MSQKFISRISFIYHWKNRGPIPRETVNMRTELYYQIHFFSGCWCFVTTSWCHCGSIVTIDLERIFFFICVILAPKWLSNIFKRKSRNLIFYKMRNWKKNTALLIKKKKASYRIIMQFVPQQFSRLIKLHGQQTQHRLLNVPTEWISSLYLLVHISISTIFVFRTLILLFLVSSPLLCPHAHANPCSYPTPLPWKFFIYSQ